MCSTSQRNGQWIVFLKRERQSRGEKGRGGKQRKASGSAQRKSQGHSDQAYCNDFSLRSHIHAPPQRSYLHSACSASLHLQLLVSAAATAAAAAEKSPHTEAPKPGLLLLDPTTFLRSQLEQASSFQKLCKHQSEPSCRYFKISEVCFRISACSSHSELKHHELICILRNLSGCVFANFTVFTPVTQPHMVILITTSFCVV